MNEKWKPIKNYEDLYTVSDKGRIKSIRKKKFIKILSPSSDKDGYKQIGIRDKDGNRKWFRMHRIVAETFIPNPENLEFINHKDNIVYHNDVDNLEWCAMNYNNKYRFSHGNASHKGEKHSQCTITDKIAEKIYIIGWTTNTSEPDIAKYFNTTRSIVNKIRLGKSFTHVTDKINIKKTRVNSNIGKHVITDRSESFSSIGEASIVVNRSRSNIRNCINGKSKSCANRKWYYIKDDINENNN